MVDTGRILTQLENELFEKIDEIKKFKMEPKYLPHRVEPGIAFDLEQESKWSKFVGTTLFINQKILNNPALRECIFWREAFLLIAPKKMREFWWVKALANSFPLSINQKKSYLDAWEKLWKQVFPYSKEELQLYKLVINSAGSEGLIDVLKQAIYQNLIAIERVEESNGIIDTISHDEFMLFLGRAYHNSIGISDTAIELMKIALIKQTTRPTTLEQFIDRSPSTISKTINKLEKMNVLFSYKKVNHRLLGLSTYFVLLLTTKKQSVPFYSYYPSCPFLQSQKINCLGTCTVTQLYFGPKKSSFKEYLERYCQALKESNKIIDYFIFQEQDSYRSYQFKHFDQKTRKNVLELTEIAIKCKMFEYAGEKDYLLNKKEDNILVKTEDGKNVLEEIERFDIEIINQFFQQIYARRAIQKNLQKDMNEIVDRINFLKEKKVIYNQVMVILPDSLGQLTIYVKPGQARKRSNKQSNKTPHCSRKRLMNLSYQLPYAFFADISGSFNGIMMHSYLPYSATIGLADFLNWFIPESVNKLIIIGNSIFQKNSIILDSSRLKKGRWIIEDEDFQF
jgi:hypothetical protein